MESYREVSICREEVSSTSGIQELDFIFGATNTPIVDDVNIYLKDSNTDRYSEVNGGIHDMPKIIKPDCYMNLDNEFHDALFNLEPERIKKFSDLNKCKNTRAWEVIQNNSNKTYLLQNEKVLDHVIKAKKTQNCGGERSRKSKVYAVNRVCNMERDTIPSSQYSQASHPISERVSKVYPHRVGQKIMRIYRKYYKTLFDQYLKKQKIVFNRVAKTMKKEKFEDLLINFMDELFAEHLENIDEETIEKLMASLSVLILKDRHKKKEDIISELDFTEWNDLVDSPNAKKSVLYFSKKENAFLYTFFFMLECKQLVEKSSESCC